MAVNDAYKLLPFADALYACDGRWWDLHKGCPDFVGEKWSSHDETFNKKIERARRYGLKLIRGERGDRFSFDRSYIRYAGNSGFQAVNLVMHFGARLIILVGFDMRLVDGKQHFFGSHPGSMLPIREDIVMNWRRRFSEAAKHLPHGIEIINATPGSALDCFPQMSLLEALKYASGAA